MEALPLGNEPPPGPPRPGDRGRLGLRAVVAGVLVLVGLWASTGPAWAHIDLVESDPADGATVDGEVETLRFTFTGAMEPAADQIALFDEDGVEIEVAAIGTAAGGTVLEVTPARPLEDGTFGVQWAARAGDAHPKVGTITFTVVSAPASSGDPGGGDVVGANPSETSNDGVGSAVPDEDAPVALSETSNDGVGSAVPDEDAPVALTAALSGPDTAGAERLGVVGRFLAYAGLLVTVGGLVYLLWVHRGTRIEGLRLVHGIRLASVAVVVGTLVQAAARVVILDGGSPGTLLSPASWMELWASSMGLGLILRIAGAALVLRGVRAELVGPADDPRSERWSDELDAYDHGSGGVVVSARTPATAPERVRVESSPTAASGAVLLVISGAFIGHTASTAPRALVAAADAAHVIAGGVWSAGVVMLAATLWRRHRHGVDLDAGPLAARFSVAAGVSLALVAATGLALGWAILGDPASLWSTDFGRVLLVKVGLVAVLAGIGAYNHFVVIPCLEDPGSSNEAGHRLKTTAAVEAGLFVLVIAATAVLVGSSST